MPDILGLIREFEETLGRFVGEELKKKVLEGSERLSNSSSPVEVAEWVKGAMERMDELIDEDTRIKVMEQCGYNCAKMNKGPIEAVVKRRRKYKSFEEFLEAVQKKPPRGMRLKMEGDTLHFYYTPRSFRKSLRCYCSLLRGLPDDETVSLTYCYCSKGFVEKYWEAVSEWPVNVDLLHSCVAGAKECKFAVHL